MARKSKEKVDLYGLEKKLEHLIKSAGCVVDDLEEEDPDTGETCHTGPIVTELHFDEGEIDKIRASLKAEDYLDAAELRGIFETMARPSARGVTLGRHALVDLIGVSHIGEVVYEIREMLLSLPWEYEILVPLANVSFTSHWEWGPEPLRVSDSIKIFIMTDKARGTEYSVIRKGRMDSVCDDDGNELFSPAYSVPMLGYPYVSIKSHGYDYGSTGTRSFEATLRVLRRLVAALIACRVFRLDERHESVWDEYFFLPAHEQGCCYVYPLTTKPRPRSLKLPTADWDLIYTLRVNEEAYRPSEFEEVQIKEGRKKDAPDDVHRRLQSRLMPIQKLFCDDANVPEEHRSEWERRFTALEWFYQGMANRNKTFSYVQFAIALEALLGEPEYTDKKGNKVVKKDIKDRLSDRCAFLVSGDSVERGEIKKKMEAAYTVRSKIVHEGKMNLRDEDALLYEDLKRYLAVALAKEISQLPTKPL